MDICDRASSGSRDAPSGVRGIIRGGIRQRDPLARKGQGGVGSSVHKKNQLDVGICVGGTSRICSVPFDTGEILYICLIVFLRMFDLH